MGSTYEDTVLDFDLNFLNQTTTNTESETQVRNEIFQGSDTQARNEKLRKAVIFLKKKVVFSHKAITRYKSARKYANILENNQVFNKEGCKQHLIEIRNLIEDVARLDTECRAAEAREKEKNEIIYDLQNKVEALQSHEKQLKLLLKEKSNSEPMRVEKKKEKANIKDRGKKGLLEKENDVLNKEIERLKKEIETLHKGNNKILHLENENETNCNQNETNCNENETNCKENETNCKENKTNCKENETNCNGNETNCNGNETNCNGNSKILSLETEIQNLLKEVEDTKNLKKVNEYLRKENARIPNLDKANEALRKEAVKIQNLEKENKTLRKENAKISNLQKEIETLRKENEKIVSLKKVNGTLHKENAKMQTLEKEIKMLTENLALVKKEKSKLRLKCQQLLCKYESLPDSKHDLGNSSETENDISEDTLLSVLPTATDPVMVKKSQTAAKDMVPLEFDNDNSNEVVSVDTGRGSSLAYSDTDKCLHSPDYFENDSLLNEANIENKENSDVVSMTKSTILFEDSDDETATDPIILFIGNEECSDTETLAIREMSPNLPTIEKSVSSIKETREIATGLVRVSENIPPQQAQDMQAKECLELNNSVNLGCESHTDLEIEKIFSRMQLSYNAVSPIPRTPAALRFLESTTRLSEDTNILKLSGRIETLGEELIELKKALNEEIEKRLCKSNQRLTLQSDNVALESQFDGDHHINNDSNKISQTENDIQTQDLLIKEPIVNKPDLKISNVKILSKDKALLSHRLSTETYNLQNYQDKIRPLQISLPKLQLDHNCKQLVSQDHYVSEESTYKEISQNIDKANISPNNQEDLNESPIKDTINARKSKCRKITKLEKLKKKLEPKYKIRRETPPLRSRIKPKQLAVTKQKQLVTVDTSSVSFNDKNVYENAVKVMAEIKSQQNNKVAKSPKQNQVPLSPKLSTNLENQNDTTDLNLILSQNDSIMTRSKRKYAELGSVVISKETIVKLTDIPKDKEDIERFDEQSPRKRRRCSINKTELQCKRILRSSTAQLRLSTENNTELSDQCVGKRKSIEYHNTSEIKSQRLDQDHSNVISYDDLDVFMEDNEPPKRTGSVKDVNDLSSCHPKESILCSMIEKYGVEVVRPFAKKVPDVKVKFVCEKLEQEIAKIIEVPIHETKNAMNILVADLRKLNYKHFITGLMKYLTKPERKTELFGKINSPPAPPMTKAEQVLLYVISHLKTHWPSVDIVDAVLSNIEYTIFKLNRTPEFDVIESTSHFYALLCRYFRAKSRLRLFILDAMYCIQFKSLPLIKQCLDVWMHVIPLAHMGLAKSPLVTCLVYLLHFYKCDDKFNRIQDIRHILNRKYFYQITDWTEKKILEMFKISILELKDIPVERKMLRLALIILAKRQGPRWCQNNIIKNLLQPMIEDDTVPNNVKVFCVSMLGPLIRPYPVDMKVHSEIVVNQLAEILNNQPSRQMEEAVITSMMFINRHDQLRINQTLLSRRMKTISPELEKLIRDYVRTKPLKMWKKTLSKITRF